MINDLTSMVDNTLKKHGVIDPSKIHICVNNWDRPKPFHPVNPGLILIKRYSMSGKRIKKKSGKRIKKNVRS